MTHSVPHTMQPYADSRATGRTHGALDMLFERTADGRHILSRLSRRAPMIVQQALYFDSQWPELPCVYTLSSGGPQVEGDRYSQRIELRAGAAAHIASGAATKVAEMTRDYSAVDTLITLGEESYLEWLPEPTILCRGARLHTSTRLVVNPSATLVYSEIYMAGRLHRGERWEFDIMSARTTASWTDGRPLWNEHLVVNPNSESIRTAGVMTHFDVWGSVTVLTRGEYADQIYDMLPSELTAEGDVAVGVTHLPNGAGLAVRIVGDESARVKACVRGVCDRVRRVVCGRRLPEEFPWR
ncbi:MAG: urease accessory protein UreD [Rikenellaceae bacterium]|nr:urease accessory protein UreD [Rikenellaceae bacterium]